jgi:hypothetical protein
MKEKLENIAQNGKADRARELEFFEARKINEYFDKVSDFCDLQAKRIAKNSLTNREIASDKNLNAGLRLIVKKLHNVAEAADKLKDCEGAFSEKQGWLYKILGGLADVAVDLNEVVNHHSEEEARAVIEKITSEFENSLGDHFKVRKIQLEKGYKIDYTQNPEIINVLTTEEEAKDQTVADVLREGYRFRDELLGEKTVKSPIIEAYKYKKGTS